MRSSGFGVVAAAVVLLSVSLAGCAPTPAPEPSASPTTSPTPAPAAGSLTCDALAPAETVAAAMTGADGVAPTPVAAIDATDALLSIELAAAGGLGCSWRTGPAPTPSDDGAGELTYLTLRVLPGAAGQYQPVWAGDAPSTDTLDVGGVTASTAIGEWGWQLSAPVGDAWVELRLVPYGLGWVGSPFDGLEPNAVLAQLAEVAAVAFPTLADASPEQLAWPRAASQRQGDAVCNGGLDPQGIGMALQAGSIEAEAYDPTGEPPRSFAAAVGAAARSMRCEYVSDGFGAATVDVVYGAGQQFELLREADGATMFETLDLSAVPGFAEGDEAVQRVLREGAPNAFVYLKTGDSVYQVFSKQDAAAVAEAILGQIR